MRSVIAVVLGCALALAGALGGCVFYLNPQCNDQIKNGDETGVDCGGTCGKCSLGEHCKINGDCDDGNCALGVCTALPCDNGVKDNAETDIDCGGGTCRQCSGGRTCQVAADCFSGTCVAGSNVCASLTVSFAPEQRFFSGYKSYALLPVDLDGDMVTDLAVINEYGSSVAVFINDFARAGSFTRRASAAKPPDEPDTRATNFGPVGAYPTGGGVADFNHDGKLDVVTADYHGNSISVLLNAGNGALNLKPVATYATVAGAETSNLAVGDVNGDNNVDVVATNPQKSSVSLFLGHADGTFDPGITIPVGVSGAAQPYSVAIEDFNGDGNRDLAIAEETSGTIIVRLGNGDGTFQAEVPYAIGGVRDYIIISRDVNLDKIPDLLCANRNGDTVSVLLGRGDGTFKKAIVTSVVPLGFTKPTGRPWFGPYSITVGDINKDGVPDIVTPNFQDDSVSILLGIGNGHFDPAIQLVYGKPTEPQFTSTTPYGVVIDDFNHDGKPDIATANAGSDDLTVRLNNGH
jgi:hypothetical protein